MSDTLSEDILNYPRLFDELGFRITSQMYEPEHFGNSLVVLENPELCVRFVRDRGQVAVEIASRLEPEDWHDVNAVLGVISPHDQMHANADEVHLNMLVETLLRTYDEIVDAFSPGRVGETKRLLNEFYNIRSRAWV